jgi:hypothetical protein
MHALKRSWGQVFDVLFDDYKEDFFLWILLFKEE